MPGRKRFNGDLSDTEERNLSELLDPIDVSEYVADEDPLFRSLFDERTPSKSDEDDPDYERSDNEDLDDDVLDYNPGFSIIDGPMLTLDDLM